jgi:hypothetical protein
VEETMRYEVKQHEINTVGFCDEKKQVWVLPISHQE